MMTEHRICSLPQWRHGLILIRSFHRVHVNFSFNASCPGLAKIAGAFETLPNQLFRASAHENGSMQILGKAFQTRSKVHGFSDYGILEALLRTHTAARQGTGMNANADVDRWSAATRVQLGV
jgi:hypothetical protein